MVIQSFSQIDYMEIRMKATEEYIDKKSDLYINNPSVPVLKSFLYPLLMGHYYYNPGYSLNRSGFDSFLIMYIVEGSCTVEFDNTKIHAEKNSIVFLDCYEEHGYSSEEGWEAVWIHFDGNTARNLYDMVTEKLGNVFTLEDPLTIMNRIAKIYEPFHKKEPIRELLLHKYLNDILVELVIYSPIQVKEVQRVSVIKDIRLYIQEHIQEELRIDDLAKQALMSTYHFIRVFKKHTGMSPHEYIINYRLRIAKSLLIQTNMSINDICYESGFTSESVFCASFKKNVGVSPTTYRKERRHL